MSKLIIYKANELAVSRYDLTENETKLILSCVALLDPTKEPTLENRTVSFTYQEYAKLLNLSEDNAYQNLKNSTRHLMTRTVEIKDPLVKGFTIFQWANFAKFTAEKLQITFSEHILPYLFQLKKFIKYNLEHVKSFENKHSMHVYEWLLKELTQRKTKKANIQISINDFKYMLMLDKSYPEYKAFNKWVLSKISHDINTYSNMRLIITKKGRPAEDLIFQVEINNQLDLVNELVKDDINNLSLNHHNDDLENKLEMIMSFISMKKIMPSDFELKFLSDMRKKHELNGSLSWLSKKQKDTILKIFNKYKI